MLGDAFLYATVPASDLQRARRFYEEKLGLQPVDDSPEDVFYGGKDGTRILVFASSGAASGTHTQVGLSVADIAAEVAELRARGVVFEEYDEPGLKSVDGIADMGTVKAAWFHDSEGNLLGVVEIAD
jgi:catechol 2,3-dioxygenase-like lactoylglutathione lyase family enzyme